MMEILLKASKISKWMRNDNPTALCNIGNGCYIIVIYQHLEMGWEITDGCSSCFTGSATTRGSTRDKKMQ